MGYGPTGGKTCARLRCLAFFPLKMYGTPITRKPSYKQIHPISRIFGTATTVIPSQLFSSRRLVYSQLAPQVK